jgi:hypothetical protein
MPRANRHFVPNQVWHIILWIGATGEYEKVISESLTKALNRAAKEFASDEFYGILRK